MTANLGYGVLDVQLLGFAQEVAQLTKEKDSAFSYEDIPSNKAGAKFGEIVKDNDETSFGEWVVGLFTEKEEPKMLSELLKEYLLSLNPKTRQKSPNWNDITKGNCDNGDPNNYSSKNYYKNKKVID